MRQQGVIGGPHRRPAGRRQREQTAEKLRRALKAFMAEYDAPGRENRKEIRLGRAALAGTRKRQKHNRK